MEQQYCRYCGAKISSNSKYCRKCGCEINPIPQASKSFFNKTITCKTCGAQIAYTAKACPHCGAKPTNRMIGDALIGAVGGLLAVPFIIIAILIMYVLFKILL